MKEFEDDVEGVEFLAGINHVLDKHRNDDTPRPRRLSPPQPDLVQIPGEKGYWDPSVTPEDRARLKEELRKLVRHQREHVEFLDDCHFCDQEKEKWPSGAMHVFEPFAKSSEGCSVCRCHKNRSWHL